MRSLLPALLVLTACQIQPPEAPGPGVEASALVDPAAGPAGAPGAAGPGVFWADATGAVAAVGATPMHFDANGVGWPLDVETAELAVLETWPRYVAFESSDCTGPAYVRIVTPGTAFKMGAEWRVRPATVRSTAGLTFGSMRGVASLNTNCVNGGPSDWTRAVRLDDTLVVDPPTLGFAAPLHPGRQ